MSACSAPKVSTRRTSTAWRPKGCIFRNFHVAQPVCSASRAGLLTGCYPNRIGIHGALGPRTKVGISSNEMTLAELVKQRGYATAIFGKWHLGDAPQFLPLQHGFDEYFGLPYSNDMWPLHPDLIKLPPNDEKRKRGYPDLIMFEGNKVVIPQVTHEDQNQLTTWYAERAVKFIEQNKDRPFFLYLAHNMPHVPLHVSDKFRGKTERGLYGDVIEEIDWSVGQVMDALKRTGLGRQDLGDLHLGQRPVAELRRPRRLGLSLARGQRHVLGRRHPRAVRHALARQNPRRHRVQPDADDH